MSDTIFFTPFIFAGIAILSYSGTKLFNYLSLRLDGFSFNQTFKNKRNYRLLQSDIYKFKYKRLHDKAFYYYLNLCVNNAFDLAYDLASRDLKRVAKEKRVNLLYDKLFREKTEV